MTSFSLFERIKIIFETIFSSSFFITLLVILIFTIALLILNTRLKSKAPKIIAVFSYTLLMILILARYGGYVLAINDSVVEKFFKAMYFPNLVVYIAMLFITLLLLVLNFINKNYSRITKIFNIICFALIWFFFVLVLDTCKTNNINIYEITEIYANSTIMILLQASMCVFFVWIGVLIMNLVVRKAADKLDKQSKEITIENNTNNYQDDDIKEFSDEDFQNSYLKLQEHNKTKEISKIFKEKDF